LTERIHRNGGDQTSGCQVAKCHRWVPSLGVIEVHSFLKPRHVFRNLNGDQMLRRIFFDGRVLGCVEGSRPQSCARFGRFIGFFAPFFQPGRSATVSIGYPGPAQECVRGAFVVFQFHVMQEA